MARALRIAYPGAVYHIMACGNHGQDIFQDDRDRRARESSLGMVAAGRDNCFVAVGERAARDGPLHASDRGDQPDERGCWAEARTTTAQTAEVGMKGKQDEETTCHNSRTDPSETQSGCGRPVC